MVSTPPLSAPHTVNLSPDDAPKLTKLKVFIPTFGGDGTNAHSDFQKYEHALFQQLNDFGLSEDDFKLLAVENTAVGELLQKTLRAIFRQTLDGSAKTLTENLNNGHKQYLKIKNLYTNKNAANFYLTLADLLSTKAYATRICPV